MANHKGQQNSFICLLTALLLAALLSACSLPVEELRTGSVVRADDRAQYPTDVCSISDIVSMDSITVRALPKKDALLGFSVSTGEEHEYRGVYVSTGEKVTGGQVLAELDAGDLPQELREMEIRLEELQEKIRGLDARYEIAKRRTEIQSAGMNWADRQAMRDEAEEKYQAERALISDEIEFSEMRLQRLTTAMEAYVITAPFDGTVLSAVSPQRGETYTEGRNIIRVAELSQTIFQGETTRPEIFREDRIYTIRLDKEETNVRLVSASEVSQPQKTEESPAKYYVYFLPEAFSETVSYSKNYSVSFESAHRESVLSVPTSAVYHANDQYYVYTLNENGSRVLRFVEIGARNEYRTEILSGLREGEVIISE